MTKQIQGVETLQHPLIYSLSNCFSFLLSSSTYSFLFSLISFFSLSFSYSNFFFLFIILFSFTPSFLSTSFTRPFRVSLIVSFHSEHSFLIPSTSIFFCFSSPFFPTHIDNTFNQSMKIYPFLFIPVPTTSSKT